ncbi:MAG: hypothetical protein ACSHYB_12215 [Roseibacillus sp.]
MKYTLYGGVFAALSACALSAQTTLTVNDFSYRSSGVFGAPSEGLIEIDPDAGFTAPGGGSLISDIPLRWSGLDLNGDSTADDYINFTLRITGNQGTVAMSNQGIGLKSGTDSINDNLNPGEEMIIEIINPVLSPSVTAGAATFDGFTQAAIGGGGNGPDPDPTVGQTNANINGVDVTISVNDTAQDPESGYIYTAFPPVDFSLQPSVFFKDITTVAIGDTETVSGFNDPVSVLLTNRVRAFDFQLSYDPAGTPVTPPVCFTTDNLRVFATAGNTTLGLAQNLGFPFGTIIENPDAGFDLATEVPGGGSASFDVPLRFDGIDLDGVGVDDDYFNFVMRVYSTTGSGARFAAGNGIGVNGGETWGIGSGEGVFVEIVDLELKPGIVGAVEFAGFNEVGVGAGGSAGAGLLTQGDAALDVNGTETRVILDGDGFQFSTARHAFFPTPATGVTFDNSSFNQVTAAPSVFEDTDPKFSAYVRDFDLKFNYLAEGTPAPIATECFTVTDLNLRNNATYVFNGTATSDGSTIQAAPGFDGTMIVPSPTVDLPLRWNFLDFDGTETFDDFVDFTVRVSSGTTDNVVVTGEGIGIAGNGTNALDPSETLTLEIVNATASTGKTVDFNFTTGKLFASGNAGDGVVTDGSASGDINGSTISLSLPNINSGDGGEAYENVAGATAIIPGSPTLVANNAVLTPGSVTPGLRLRDFSITMCYFDVDAAPTGSPVITNCGFVDADTFFIEFTPGGAGYKVTTPTSGGLDFGGGATDVTTSLAPSGAGDNRFEFDITGDASFFRVEEN